MNSYTIDASIYALPNVDDLSMEDKKNAYQSFIDRLSYLDNILTPKKANIKLFFFRKDIQLLRKEKRLLINKNILPVLKELGVQERTMSFFDLIAFYNKFFEELLLKSTSKDTEKYYSKYTIIESHLNINVDDFNNETLLEPDIKILFEDELLKKNINKKLSLIAFLNRYVYHDTTMNKVIFNTSVNDDKINISVNINKIIHDFNINGIPEENIIIKEQIIELCKINDKNLRKIFKNVDESIKQAKIDFENNIMFCENINITIEEYKQLLEKLNKKYPENIKIKNHISEYPNTLYDYLDSLDKLVKYYKKTNSNTPINKRKLIMEKFRKKYDKLNNCLVGCYMESNSICKKCSGFFSLCRYNCSGENNEKTFEDLNYVIHAKPYSFNNMGINKDIADLSLRIYFRWDDEKIKIGYIGKHL